MTDHQPKSCSGCPLYGVGKGFVLGCGDPRRAKYAVILEAPGKDETIIELKPNAHRAFLSTKEECEEEYQRRKRDYPELDDQYLRIGAPVVGQTGLALQYWIWPKVGLQRSDFFIDNTIRCLAPKSKSGTAYPTGEARKGAEFYCRQYDRIADFRPDTVVFSLHPASLLREITPLPLVVKDFEKVRDFGAQGRRVLALLGGKATGEFMRYGGNVTRWRGHYAELAGDWPERYKDAFAWRPKKKKELTVGEEGSKKKVTRKRKKKEVVDGTNR